MRNFQLKSLSLLIAIFLWYFVTTNITTLTLTLPIEVKDAPSDKLITVSPQQAQVKLSGPAFLVSGVAASPPVIRIRIPEGNRDRYLIPLRPQDIALPSALEVEGIDPSQVELKADERLQKAVPVEVPKLGVLTENLRLEKIEVIPPSVFVSGPGSEIRALNQVESYPLDLRDIKGSERIPLSVRSPSTHVAISTDTVMVDIQVHQVETERKFGNLPVEIRSTDGLKLTINPKVVVVSVSGPKAAIASLDRGDVIPYARLTNIDGHDQDVPVAVDVPKGITVLSVEPKSVHIAPYNDAPTPSSKPSKSSKSKK